VGETYCVGGDNQPPNIDIVNTICEILDELQPDSAHVPHKQLITYVADRPGHDRRYDIDITKIEQELGWKPSYDLRQGLVDTVQWYIDNPEWVQSIVRQSDYDAWLAKNYGDRKA
jgi:dTDP-glucose 4,6-dehydratase